MHTLHDIPQSSRSQNPKLLRENCAAGDRAGAAKMMLRNWTRIMVLGGGYQESVSFSRNEVIIIQIRWQRDVKKLTSDEKWMVVAW